MEGSRHHFRCNEGYSLVGEHTLHCSEDGSWNGSVPTCLIGIVVTLVDKSDIFTEVRMRTDKYGIIDYRLII